VTFIRECEGHESASPECKTKTADGQKAKICICDTDKCNGAVMTSSFGHVITVVTLLITIIAGHLL